MWGAELVPPPPLQVPPPLLLGTLLQWLPVCCAKPALPLQPPPPLLVALQLQWLAVLCAKLVPQLDALILGVLSGLQQL